ncbi:MAG: exonuclease domain-containing protein, partial [Thermoanaerobaculia bacterium]|nr:exonuclease domain-containing protein [Thermoanaerobaculia bacterium]
VAHNAAFDMAFLRGAEETAGVSFDNPVLDTVLLSAFLEPDSPDHTLDALATRYGIGFEPGTRHTALGDARVTAWLFLSMLPLLARRDVHTLGQAARASEAAAAIRRQQRRY